MQVLRKRVLHDAAATACMVLAVLACQSPSTLAQEEVPRLLGITSPRDGTVVHPGQIVTVNVAATKSTRFQMVCANSTYPLRGGCVGAPPYVFQVRVPKVIAAGKYPLNVFGILGPRRGGGAKPITLDVEPAAKIKKLRVEVHSIVFSKSGQQFPLHVFGDFADGSSMEITHSTRLKYSGGSRDLFTVSKDGWVTCANNPYAAYAAIKVLYEDKWAVIPVSTTHVPGARPAPATPGPPSSKPRPGQPNHKPLLENGPQCVGACGGLKSRNHRAFGGPDMQEIKNHAYTWSKSWIEFKARTPRVSTGCGIRKARRLSLTKEP